MADKRLQEPLNPDLLASCSTVATTQASFPESADGVGLGDIAAKQETSSVRAGGPASFFVESTECRLCFDEAGPEGLIAPCDCSGSMKWVHRSCLNQYRYHAQPTQQKAMTHCPTCAYEYQLYCTFDVANQRKSKRKRCLRMTRDGLAVFITIQLAIVLLGLIIRQVDSGSGWVLKNTIHWPGMYHGALSALTGQQFFLYWSLAFVLVLVLTGIAGLAILAVSCCRGQAQAREPRIVYGRRENCCDDCSRGCFYIDPIYADPCYCAGCDGDAGACACDGEAGLVLLVIVVVLLLVLGIFVALMALSLVLQRTGQRYLKALHLKDVAERFAVVDRAQAGIATAPPQALTMEQSGSAASSGNTHLSQEAMRTMLQEEIKLTSSVIRNRVREVVQGNQD